MKTLAIITHTPHWVEANTHYAYGPYVREMNLWIKQVDHTIVVAPKGSQDRSDIHWAYSKRIKHRIIPSVSLLGFRQKIRTCIYFPILVIAIFKAMRQADHIHLRCPGNIGLIGCLVQLCFPRKRKSAKYAGNWDPQSKQPWSYRLQQWILRNTFLTRNMQVLVYGEWANQTANITPFFTASYSQTQIPKQQLKTEIKAPYRFLFVGSLVAGKRPEYAIDLIQNLKTQGLDVQLDFYGDGILRETLEETVKLKELQDTIKFHGNQEAQVVQEAYKYSHFLMLPSKSEGWPKVVAEAMFWNCVPLVCAVSCVPWMLNYGERGIVLSLETAIDTKKISDLITDEASYVKMVETASQWSQEYTLETFEHAIQSIV